MILTGHKKLNFPNQINFISQPMNNFKAIKNLAKMFRKKLIIFSKGGKEAPFLKNLTKIIFSTLPLKAKLSQERKGTIF